MCVCVYFKMQKQEYGKIQTNVKSLLKENKHGFVWAIYILFKM